MAKRRVFYSFHYIPDSWRAAQVRNMGVVEGNRPATDNDWEEIKRGGDASIKRWIDNQIKYKSCTVVLVGNMTANRKWINYEIKKSWSGNKGVVGIYIHGMRDRDGRISRKGNNPFDYISHDNGRLSRIVKCYNPQGSNSRDRYNWISRNISAAVEEAIDIRGRH